MMLFNEYQAYNYNRRSFLVAFLAARKAFGRPIDGAGVLPYALYDTYHRAADGQKKQRRADVNIKKNLLLSLLSGVILGVHFIVYFTAVKYTSISSCTTFATMEAFFVAFALVFIFKEKVSTKSWLGIVVTFIGACLIAAADFNSGSNRIKGDALAVLACVLVSSYTVIGRYVRKSGVSTNTYTCIVYVAAMITVALSALVTCEQIYPVSGRTLLCSLGLTVFCTLLGHSVFSWGLKYVQASYISNAKMMSPAFATVWGVLFFHEVPGVLSVIGIITVIAGVLYYSNNLTVEK